MSVCGCLSPCGPVMDWRPVQGVPRLSPDDHWDRLQPPRDPTDGLSGYRKWMDGWMIHPSVIPIRKSPFCQKDYNASTGYDPAAVVAKK